MSRSPPSSRWCPTAEQLVILRELYARGLTNPNAFQIQTITAQLSNYGKIQGKNVFYWFQNHKARERQRLTKKHYVVVKQQRLMQQYQINPSSAFLQLFTTSYSPKYLYPQGAGCSVAASEGMMKQAWRTDLPTDGLIRTNGHDLTMIMDASPTLQCCKPLETLELFPLRSGGIL